METNRRGFLTGTVRAVMFGVAITMPINRLAIAKPKPSPHTHARIEFEGAGGEAWHCMSGQLQFILHHTEHFLKADYDIVSYETYTPDDVLEAPQVMGCGPVGKPFPVVITKNAPAVERQVMSRLRHLELDWEYQRYES